MSEIKDKNNRTIRYGNYHKWINRMGLCILLFSHKLWNLQASELSYARKKTRQIKIDLSSDGFKMFLYLVILIGAVALAFYLFYSYAYRATKDSREAREREKIEAYQRKIQNIKKKIPDFTEDAFKEHIRKTYLRILRDSINQANWNMAEFLQEQQRMFLQQCMAAGTKSSKEILEKQMELLEQQKSAADGKSDMFDRRLGITIHYRKADVDDIRIIKYIQKDEQDYIVTELDTTTIRYSTNDLTGKIISGNKDKAFKVTYQMIVYRAAMKLDSDEEKLCPNCGAPVSYGIKECPYCYTALKDTMQDWMMYQFNVCRRKW